MACPCTERSQQAPQGHHGDTCLHLFTTGSSTGTSAASQECKDGGERASRRTFAKTKLPLGLTGTDLSASLGLGAGCYIVQPGFLRTPLPATARLGLRLQLLARQATPYRAWVSARAPPGPSNAVNFHTPAQLGREMGKRYAILLLLAKPKPANLFGSLGVVKNTAEAACAPSSPAELVT